MGWKDFFFGEDESYEKQDLLSKEGRSKLNNFLQNPIEKSPLFSAGSSHLQKLLSGDPQAYADFERPFYENFDQNIAPGIAERYAGAGTGSGALSSSAFNSSIAQAGRGLQTDLASLRGNLQNQALPQALAYANQPYENTLRGVNADQNSWQTVHRPGTEGFLKPLAQAGLTAAGTAIGGPLGGIASSALGNTLFNRQGVPGQ